MQVIYCTTWAKFVYLEQIKLPFRVGVPPPKPLRHLVPPEMECLLALVVFDHRHVVMSSADDLSFCITSFPPHPIALHKPTSEFPGGTLPGIFEKWEKNYDDVGCKNCKTSHTTAELPDVQQVNPPVHTAESAKNRAFPIRVRNQLGQKHGKTPINYIKTNYLSPGIAIFESLNSQILPAAWRPAGNRPTWQLWLSKHANQYVHFFTFFCPRQRTQILSICPTWFWKGQNNYSNLSYLLLFQFYMVLCLLSNFFPFSLVFQDFPVVFSSYRVYVTSYGAKFRNTFNETIFLVSSH